MIWVFLVSFFWAMERGGAQPLTDSPSPPKDPEIPSSLTSQLFKITRPAVFQIKTSLAANSPKASYGSAFAISTEGLLVTNYHVVAKALQDEENSHKIFLVSKSGSIEAQVIGIDSTHDLALIKVNRKFKSYLKLATRPVKKGDKIYSVGLPKDLNISLTEGNYNGTIKYGIYEQIHMSSPINSGMSGGPTINRKGEVVGVNVSVLLYSQNISFSVPAKFIKRLLEPGNIHADLKADLDSIIEGQLLSVQESLMEDMKKNVSKMGRIEQWKIAPPSNSLKCWSNYKNEPKVSYKKNHQYCSLKAKSYLRDGFYGGDYEINYVALTNKKRNNMQFYHLINYLYNFSSELDYGITEEFKRFMTRFECSEKIVVNDHKIPFKVNFCLQAFTRYPKLYSCYFKAVSLVGGKTSFFLKANIRGFSKENIKEFIFYQLSNIEYER